MCSSTVQHSSPSQAKHTCTHTHIHSASHTHPPSPLSLPPHHTTPQVLISVDITNFQKRYRAILERNRSVLLRGSEASSAGPSQQRLDAVTPLLQPSLPCQGIIEAERLNGADNETYYQTSSPRRARCYYWINYSLTCSPKATGSCSSRSLPCY